MSSSLTRACLFLSLLVASQLSFGQSAGKVIEQKIVHSAVLHKDVHYTVYLPADYGTSERSYPVVYLLHGYSDDNTGWLQFGEVNRYADKAIADGTIPPMIIVMPDGGTSWYINSYDGKENYEDFLIKEFMPAVEKDFRTRPEKSYRGVAGLSMGGYGSLMLAFKHPDLFAAAATLSAAIFDDIAVICMPKDDWDHTFAQLFGQGLTGKDRLNAAWYAHSLLKIAETTPADDLKKVRYWLDCGDDDDRFTKGNCLLHISFLEKGIPHEFRVRDGGHTWTYWRTGIVDALQFIGTSFRRQ